MISFSQGLLLFTAVLTPAYLVILMLADRKGADIKSTGFDVRVPLLLLAVMALLTFTLLHLPGFKSTLFYLLLAPIMVAGLIFCVIILRTGSKHSHKGLLLFLVLLLHIIIVYQPPFGIAINERSVALAQTAIEGHYNTSHPLLHPTYNPFPMDIGLLLTLTNIAGLSPISKVSGTIFSLSILLVIDLMLFSLVRRLTGRWTPGILAVLLFAMTPPVNFIEHHCKLAALMLVFIASFMLTWAFKRRGQAKRATATLAYIGGIFYHATAGLGMFLLAGILASGGVLKRFIKERDWEYIYRSKLFRLSLVSFIVYTLVRWLYGGGFEEIVPTLHGYVLQMLQWKEKAGEAAPLYDRAGVNSVQAYAWATPVAMASALILYILIKRRSPCDALIPSLAVGSGTFLLIGFTSAYLRSGFGASMYPGFGLLMPAAAITLYKTLRSNRFVIVILVIALVMLSAVVAVRDPMLSPKGWATELKGVPQVGEEQLSIASTLVSIAPQNKKKVIAGEVVKPLRYLNLNTKAREFRYNPQDPSAYIQDFLVLQGRLKSDVLYILRSEQIFPYMSGGELGGTQINIIFNSERYIGFTKSLTTKK